MRRVHSVLLQIAAGAVLTAIAPIAALSSIALLPSTAEADRRPRLASDAFYVGMRVDPGVALLAAWDLDIYLSRDRALSLGPGISVAVLGTESTDGGRDQDFLLCADILRFKVGVNEPGGSWHPYFMLGIGFLYARMPAQTEMFELGPMTPLTRPYSQLEEFAGMLTFGAGADLFADGPWALALIWQNRYRLSGSSRIPDVWSELALGIRFGI
jgi:hypothetical protein